MGRAQRGQRAGYVGDREGEDAATHRGTGRGALRGVTRILI